MLLQGIFLWTAAPDSGCDCDHKGWLTFLWRRGIKRQAKHRSAEILIAIGNVLGSFTAADQSIVCWSHGVWWLSPPAMPILFTPLPL
ncbi:unnamed protein product [Boreogadus saida]